jgi:hypothetical protein
MSLGDPNSPYNRYMRERGKIKYIPFGDPDKPKPPSDTPKSKHGGNEKQELFAKPLVKKRRRSALDGEVDESVYEDFTQGLGFRPASISEVSSRDYQA